MKVQKLTGGFQDCGAGTCPAIFRTDRDTLVVQGKLIKGQDLAEFSLPSDEGVVEIPEALLRDLSKNLLGK